MADFSIAEAGSGDLDRVEALWRSMHAHHRDNPPPDELLQEVPFRDEASSWERRRHHYEQWLAEDPDSRLLLATDSTGRAVGYAFIRVNAEQASMATGRIGMLESLSVLPDQRGSGLGRALVDTMLDHFRNLGLEEWSLEVMVGNERTQRFYESLGLQPYLISMLGRVPASDESPGN